MAKKSNSLLSYLYLIGMALVIIGSFLPLTTALGGNIKGASAFSVITSKNYGGIIKVGSILALLGAVAGAVLCFIKVGKAGFYKLIALIVSVCGGLYVFFNISKAGRKILSGLSKSGFLNFGIGFYVILIGWILAIVAFALSRE